MIWSCLAFTQNRCGFRAVYSFPSHSISAHRLISWLRYVKYKTFEFLDLFTKILIFVSQNIPYLHLAG